LKIIHLLADILTSVCIKYLNELCFLLI
jgi:hypothetical protein